MVPMFLAMLETLPVIVLIGEPALVPLMALFIAFNAALSGLVGVLTIWFYRQPPRR